MSLLAQSIAAESSQKFPAVPTSAEKKQHRGTPGTPAEMSEFHCHADPCNRGSPNCYARLSSNLSSLGNLERGGERLKTPKRSRP